MTQSKDNSVLFALDELKRLEADRLAEDERARRAAVERLEQERARKAQEHAAQEEQARRVAQEEARLRVQADLRARDAEAERRLAALRAELAAVQADRERMHASIVGAAGDDWAETARARSSRGWLVAFGAATAAAVGLAIVLALRPPVVQERIVEVPVAAAATEDRAPEPPPVDVAAAEPAPDPVEPATSPVQTARPTPRPSHPAVSPRPTPMDDPLGDLDRCGDDVLCGAGDLGGRGPGLDRRPVLR